jgi:hypothetical protein
MLALAILVGAGAPLAGALVQPAPAPAPQREIARTLIIACPHLNLRERGDRPTPWLGRCGLPR